MTTKRLLILQALVARLEQITAEGGYATNAGESVLLGEAPILGPDDPTFAINIVPQDDRPGSQLQKIQITWPIPIQALAKMDLDEPWVVVEQVLGDIKKAIESGDRTLGGLVSQSFERGSTRTIPRETGQTTVGAEIIYIFSYVEVWGHPEHPVLES